MKRRAVLCFFFFFTVPLWSVDNFSIIGMRLDELFERFGPPKAVFAARGNEIWQDDVIFQYEGRDFYIYRDRVWQVKVVTELGVSVGDSKQAAALTLGNMAEDRGDHLLVPLSGKDWPMIFRVNINSSGRVNAIYIYRIDY